LVLFAAEDVWSGLQSLCWLQSSGKLGTVFIYQTAEKASANPAERLRKFCSRRWPTLRVVVPGEPGVASAAKVEERLQDWRRFRPECTRWVVDATGATRSMFGGVAKMLVRDKAFEAIYRGPKGVWQKLSPSGSDWLEAVPLEPTIPYDVTDALPVTELVEFLANDVAEIKTSESRAPEALAPSELGRVAAAGGACNWDWNRMYTEALARPPKLAEFTFQDFVAASLLAMDVRNVRVNLTVVRAGSRPVETVLDVIANRGGRIFVFDCRARDEQRDPGPEARPVALDGLWPVCVALRPNRWATDAERMLSAMSGNAHVLDANSCRHLFSSLGELLDVKTPFALLEIERAALKLGASRLPVFTPATQAQRLGDAVRVDDQVFDLVKGGRVETGGLTAWRAARVSPGIWFVEGRVVNGAGVGTEMQRRLQERFDEARLPAAMLYFEVTFNKKFWHALVRVSGDNDPTFSKWLQKWRKLPLIV
jgi:hypothetical protein